MARGEAVTMRVFIRWGRWRRPGFVMAQKGAASVLSVCCGPVSVVVLRTGEIQAQRAAR